MGVIRFNVCPSKEIVDNGINHRGESGHVAQRPQESCRTVVGCAEDAPIAEAWYLAAQLTNDDGKKKTYLRRAVILDKNFEPARRMLAEVKGELSLKRSSLGAIIRDEIGTDKSSTQNRRPAKLDAAIAAAGEDAAEHSAASAGFLMRAQQIAVVVLAIVLVGLVANLLTRGDDASTNNTASASSEAPAVELPPLQELPERDQASTQAVLTAYQQAGYRPQVATEDAFSGATYKYAMRARVGTSTALMLLYIYEQPATSDHARTIAANLQDYDIDVGANMVLALPDEMDETTADDVREIFLDQTQIVLEE